jgi:hypothetical protein
MKLATIIFPQQQIDRMGRERMKQHLDIADSFLYQ